MDWEDWRATVLVIAESDTTEELTLSFFSIGLHSTFKTFQLVTKIKKQIRDMYPSVHCSTVYNNQDMEKT